MARRRGEKKSSVKAEYIARRKAGEKVVLKDLAKELGVNYKNLCQWRKEEQWDEQLDRKRGGQPKNKNAKGNSGGAAPIRNKNAEKDGAYSTIFFDELTDAEKQAIESTELRGQKALEEELKLLKFRESKILAKIAYYENKPEDELYLHSVTDMRVPGGKGSSRSDGVIQQLGMYNKDSAFARVLKLDEALYKIQGRIATIVTSLRAIEDSEKRLDIEHQRLEIMKMKATGAVDVDILDEVTDYTDEQIIHEQGSSTVDRADGKKSKTAKGRGNNNRGKTGAVRSPKNRS